MFSSGQPVCQGSFISTSRITGFVEGGDLPRLRCFKMSAWPFLHWGPELSVAAFSLQKVRQVAEMIVPVIFQVRHWLRGSGSPRALCRVSLSFGLPPP